MCVAQVCYIRHLIALRDISLYNLQTCTPKIIGGNQHAASAPLNQRNTESPWHMKTNKTSSRDGVDDGCHIGTTRSHNIAVLDEGCADVASMVGFNSHDACKTCVLTSTLTAWDAYAISSRQLHCVGLKSHAVRKRYVNEVRVKLACCDQSCWSLSAPNTCLWLIVWLKECVLSPHRSKPCFMEPETCSERLAHRLCEPTSRAHILPFVF